MQQQLLNHELRISDMLNAGLHSARPDLAQILHESADNWLAKAEAHLAALRRDEAEAHAETFLGDLLADGSLASSNALGDA